MNEMYEMITKKKRAQQELEKALMNGKPAKGMYAYDSDEDTEGNPNFTLILFSYACMYCSGNNSNSKH